MVNVAAIMMLVVGGGLCLVSAQSPESEESTTFPTNRLNNPESAQDMDQTTEPESEESTTFPTNRLNNPESAQDMDQTTEPGCEDQDDLCSTWSEFGECEANPDFMLPTCPVSCNSCPGPGDDCVGQSCQTCLSQHSTASITNSNTEWNIFQCGSFNHSVESSLESNRPITFPVYGRSSRSVGRFKRWGPVVAGGDRGTQGSGSGDGKGSGGSSFGGDSSTLPPEVIHGNSLDPATTTPASTLPPEVVNSSIVPFEDIFCGVSLISDQYILTAAHCIQDTRPGLIVTLGEVDFSTDSDGVVAVDHEVEKVIIHPEYNRNSFIRYHDLALLKLCQKVQFTEFIWPYCLPPPDINVVSLNLTVSGWGKVNSSHTSPHFQQAVIPAIPNSECEASFTAEDYEDQLKLSYPQGITDNVICAGQPGKGACEGDNGGPLTYRDEEGRETLVGVVSVGLSCSGQSNLPGLYANLAKYVNWINSVISG